MSKEENTQRVKNEALNRIRNIFKSHSSFVVSHWQDDGSPLEQIATEVESIIIQMEKELKAIKSK